MSPRHKEALAHLLYGIRMGGGFVALTGEVGTGKTTICHCLLRRLPENIDIALILNPKLNALELLASICDELGIHYGSFQPTLKSLIDELNKYLLAAHAKGRRTVLMIDEAQNLSFDVLEQIRLLTNLETHKTKLLQIILAGQPELKDLLNHKDLRQLNQRITARYHLIALSRIDTRAYIKHRLTVCGGDPNIIKNSAIRKIYQLSTGIPRLINILCDRALLGAYANGEKVVKVKTVNRAAKEVLAPADNNTRLLRTVSLLTTLVIVIIGTAYYLYGNKIVSFYQGMKFTPQQTVENKASEKIPPVTTTQFEPVSTAPEKIPPATGSQVEPLSTTLENTLLATVPKLDPLSITLENIPLDTPSQVEQASTTLENIPLATASQVESVTTAVEQVEPEKISDIIKETQAAKKETKTTPAFSSFITNPKLNIDKAMVDALELWGEMIPEGKKVDCPFTQTINLHCLYERGVWQNILEMNRPVVMEFTLPGGDKRYGVLIGIQREQAVLRFEDDYIFPLDEVIAYWKGYYLLLWKPPFKNLKYMMPQQRSKSILWVREQLNRLEGIETPATQSYFYDDALKTRVIKFQRQHHLTEDGIIGPKTTIQLKNSAETISFPTLEITN